MKRSIPPYKFSGDCNKGKPTQANTLEDLVETYRKLQKNSDGCCEYLCGLLWHYQKMNSLKDVIESAACAKNAQGKRHSHQYRIPQAAIENAKKILKKGIKNENSFQSFEALHEWFANQCSNKNGTLGMGLGPLYVYDTCLRIGAYLKLMPEHVYLHSGALTGARALLGAVRRKKLPVSDFPKAMQVLKSHEIEDFLCIYKIELSNFKF
jgi:hypothetical protein